MQHGFAQSLQTSYPHFGGRKGVHPGNHAYALLIRDGFYANVLRLVRVAHDRLKFHFDAFQAGIQKFRHFLAVRSHLPERFFSVKVLTSRDKI